MQGTIGISIADVGAASSVPQFTLGVLGLVVDPADGSSKLYIYGRAAAAITGRGYAVVEQGTPYTFAHITTANTAPGQFGHGSRVAVAQAALATNEYGWFQVYGKGPLRTAASTAKGTRLNTTATAGVVESAGTAGSRAINGIVLGTATGGAEATNETAVLTFPSVGVTL
jgi:hypothetical protein